MKADLLFGLAVILACFSFGVWNATYRYEMCKPGEPQSATVTPWKSWKIKDMHQFEEELTCSICYSLFEDPRVLPCSHTFCRSCLEGVIQLSSNFSIWRPLRVPLKCPNCRSVVEIPASGTESLPINFALKAIIEKYRQEDHSDVATCSEHYRQPLNVYCLLDKKLVCGHCLTIGKHNGHPIDDLHSAYLKEKESSGKILEQLTDKHWSDVCLLIEKLKEQKSQCESIVQDDKKVVVQYFKKLNETLEHKKQVLLAALDEVNRQILEEYEPHIERLKKIREEQLELMSLNTSIQKEESPLVFLEKVDSVHQRIKALKEKELPDVKPVEIYPRVGHLLKDVWSKTEIGQINKILTPKIKLVPKRKLHSRSSEKERGKPEELLQAANPLSVTFIFTVIIVIAVLSFHKPISSVVIESIPTYVSDFLFFIYQDFCTSWQNTVDVVCYKLNLLAEFLGRIVPI